MDNLPLSFCESVETRRYTTPVSVNTLVSSIESVTKAVEKAIGEEMPDEFGLMLDDWSQDTEQFWAIYGCYDSPGGPRYPLLSMAPVMDEPDDHLNAEERMRAIVRFLPFFGKTISGCKFLVGDNCAVNKRLANLMNVPLVGCARHRLSLAVREFLVPFETALDQVQQLMRKHRTKPSCKMRMKTPLMPILSQDTRWSSTFSMLERYIRLREFLSANDDDMMDLLPSRAGDELTLLDARDLFDGLLELRPSMTTYLSPDAEIVHSPAFEAAVVKMLVGDAGLLTNEEARALEPFRVPAEALSTAEVTSSIAKEGFADQILNRRKIVANPSTYNLLSVIPPTSNRVERFFQYRSCRGSTRATQVVAYDSRNDSLSEG
ncbi:hypothetical protein F444_20004 [Phytophthora nicotianae P1976]|uniref:HAT C-terminal dimerisation domain-containing protein n=1 Tax=Phytophthora nicotianae P1976 TaxID=1317066 RepID=A0A080Z5Z9_PHYNI|nr:hypothetical protein F444_20004 [Phytophthora nicotianae P1976]